MNERKMEEASSSKSNGQQLCQLCNLSQQRYTCPKCEVPYCSLTCYKSESHLECSESFYKQCVEEELKVQEQDPETRRKMIDILKRMQAENIEFENDFDEDDYNDENSTTFMDSDDEEDIPDLAERLNGVDLDDANQLWAALTDTEKQEFEATLRNGEATNFLPQWIPWWSDVSERKVIQEIVDDNVEPEYVAKCPKIVDVPAFNELMKASPFVRFNILNVLYAYVYMVLHCNGDHQNAAKDSVKIFLQLSENMLQNKVYENSQTAIEAVFQKCMDCPSLAGSEDAMLATEQAVNSIINGPERSNQTFYVLAALSDLHRLFTNAKEELSRKERSKDRTFMRKFRISDSAPELTKKMILPCTKKIEYYLSWIKKYGISVDE